MLSFSVEAQVHTTSRYQIKLYALTTNNTLAVNSEYSPNTYATSYIFSNPILNPTIAINKETKKGNRQEIELTSLAINETTVRNSINTPTTIQVATGFVAQENKLAMRYEYIYIFLKNRKLQPSIGAAIAPYYLKFKYTPLTTTLTPFKETAFGLQTFIVPRVSLHISQRFLIDLNFPLKVSDNQFSTRKEYNPALADNTTNNSSNTLFQNMFYARLGVGINI